MTLQIDEDDPLDMFHFALKAEESKRQDPRRLKMFLDFGIDPNLQLREQSQIFYNQAKNDVNFSDPLDNDDNSVKSKDQKYPETAPKHSTNTGIHVVPEASLTSLASPRIYKVSWMNSDYWVCRYCGLKGDRSSLEKHHCCIITTSEEKKEEERH